MDKQAYKLWKERHKKKEWRRDYGPQKHILTKWNVLLATSYLMMGLGIWGLFVIFGPVARVEATYQIKAALQSVTNQQGTLIDRLAPNIRFDLVKSEVAQGYGIVIPKLFIQEEVVADVDPANKAEYLPALKRGIAHARGTSKAGEAGLGYYFAHSSGLDAPLHGGRAVFYLLSKLEAGDEVYIYREGEKHEYRVIGKQVVEADYLDFLNESTEGERIVLQTCWPVGTSSKRLLVAAERV